MRAFKTSLFFLALASSAWGALLKEPYLGVRPTGMGNAFLALSDDNNALWYNPAGLARVKKYSTNMFDTSIGFDSRDTLNRMVGAFIHGLYSNLVRPDTEWFRLNVRPTILMPYFGFCLFANSNTFVDLQNLTNLNATVQLYSFTDVGAAVAVGIPFGPYFAGGITVRYFARTGIDTTLTAVDLITGLGVSQAAIMQNAYTQIAKMYGGGRGGAVDLGVTLTVPLPDRYPEVKIAGTMTNVGVTTFISYLGNAPPPIYSTYNLGASLKHDFGKGRELVFTGDLKHIGGSYIWPLKVGIGAEYTHRFIAIRAGGWQGYPTAGLSLHFPPHTQLHFSTFSMELGDAIWTRQQRWYLAQIVVGFNPN